MGVIATLNGTVRAIGLDSLVLEVGGIGYAVRTSPPTLRALRHGQSVTMHTELVVREDSLTLYGFLTHEDVELFRTVQSVSGIGPRIALAVLAVMPPEQFARAVIGDDIKTITSIPGIGPKGAKRLALELKEKVAPFAVSDAAGESPEQTVEATADTASSPLDLNPHSSDVVKALIGLGWPEKSATSAVEAVVTAAEEETPGSAAQRDAADLLRHALRQLGGRQ